MIDAQQTRELDISNQERRWVLLFALLVMVLTSLPYLLGYAMQGEATRFTGFVFAVEDGNSYIAKMLAGASGAWLFRTPYSTMPQQGVLMFLPYLLLGKLAAPPGMHEQLVVLYQLFRFVAGILMILASYDFLAFFVRPISLRRFGLALIILGGGLGWVLVLAGADNWLGSLPLDFYSPETFGFLGLFGIPHLALARALLLWALVDYLTWMRSASGLSAQGGVDWRVAARISILWLLAGITQPLSMLVIGAVIILHQAGLWLGQLRRPDLHWVNAQTTLWVAVAGVAPGLLVLYNAWMLWRDPFLQTWTAQNIIRSPHPLHYLVAYGVVLPFAWLGGRRLLRQDPQSGWLLVGWALALPLLAYMPVDLQRRLPEGEWAVWVTLAMAALAGWYDEKFSPDDRRRKLVLLPFGLLFASTLFFLMVSFLSISRTVLPVYRPRDEVRIFERLAESAPPQSIVLTSYETGNPLPAWAPLRVVIGHGPESADLAALRPQVTAFYLAESPDSLRLELLRAWQVNYVFWGPAERALGSWDPHQAEYLQLVEQDGDYAVFIVLLPAQ